MLLISEIVGQEGAYSFLKKMSKTREVVNSLQLSQILAEADVSQNLFSELSRIGLFIDTPTGTYISSFGKKVTVLLRGINEDLEASELLSQLDHLYPNLRRYELIKEKITDYFIDSLHSYADFIRIYICSPWIRLDTHQLEKIKGAVIRASARYRELQIFVMTRPKKGYNNWKASIETFRVLRDLGAEIMTNRKLHTKLYISEPGPRGGRKYAIIGSENLTGRENIELAIKIEGDNEILKRLNQYFFEIRQEAEIFQEVL